VSAAADYMVDEKGQVKDSEYSGKLLDDKGPVKDSDCSGKLLDERGQIKDSDCSGKHVYCIAIFYFA
jgi:hypothetical protein